MPRLRQLAYCLLLAILLATPTGLRGQESDIGEEPTPSKTESAPADDLTDGVDLQKRLDALLAELQQAKQDAGRAQNRRAAELAGRTAERGKLADRLLDLQIEKQANATRLETLQNDARRTAAEAKTAIAQASSLPKSLREAAELLRVHLREIPGSEADRERLQLAVSALSDASDDQRRDAVQSVFSVLDSAHAQAYRITVREVNLFTANGRREDVKLLSLGHARFAYQTVEDGRIGLALASPRDVSGYRWSDRLTEDQQTLVRSAIAAVESKQAALVALPVDPVGRVRPDALNARPGLWRRLNDGGLVMYPLLGLALIAFGLIAERFTHFYLANRNADRMVVQVLTKCRDGKYAEAEQICQQHRGAVGRVLTACLQRRTLGQRAMEDSIQEQLLHELPQLQRFMGGIATLAAVAPLLGLLGTVTGIIRTFGVIRAFGNANPSLMAGGISEALLTTASGLVIAVPILIVHSLLRGRSERILADAERFAANLLTTLVHDGREDFESHNGLEALAVDQQAAAAKEQASSAKSARRKSKEVAVD